MIDALSKGLNQKPVMIKGVAPITPSRAFALWLALLFLYFLLLPTAAQTPHRDVDLSPPTHQKTSQAVSAAVTRPGVIGGELGGAAVSIRIPQG